MIRIHVICEGSTEERFINQVLNAALPQEHISLHPRLIGKPGHKGGRVNSQRMLEALELTLLGDPSAYCTTFFDFYGVDANFPGKSKAQPLTDTASKAACIEAELTKALQKRLKTDYLPRFIPYVQMHEFEGLLFSSPEQLAQGIYRPKLASDFSEIRAGFASPEDINDNINTAPSKRIAALVPDYQKPISGALAALEVGVSAMRRNCHLFNAWVERLEQLAPI